MELIAFVLLSTVVAFGVCMVPDFLLAQSTPQYRTGK